MPQRIDFSNSQGYQTFQNVRYGFLLGKRLNRGEKKDESKWNAPESD